MSCGLFQMTYRTHHREDPRVPRPTPGPTQKIPRKHPPRSPRRVCTKHPPREPWSRRRTRNSRPGSRTRPTKGRLARPSAAGQSSPPCARLPTPRAPPVGDARVVVVEQQSLPNFCLWVSGVQLWYRLTPRMSHDGAQRRATVSLRSATPSSQHLPRVPHDCPRADEAMRVKRGGVGPRAPGVTSLPSNAGTEGRHRRRPTFFDDQRTGGWDFTSTDLGKLKLTEEQITVRQVLDGLNKRQTRGLLQARDPGKAHRKHRRGPRFLKSAGFFSASLYVKK